MRLFFDLRHREDLFLDDEGQHFECLDAARGHPSRVLCVFAYTGGELTDTHDMVVGARAGYPRSILALLECATSP